MLARKEGRDIEYVIPRSTIVIENPIAVVDAYANKHGNQDLADAFVEHCTTPASQAAYARFGLRPISADATPAELPRAEDAFTIRDLGGWDAMREEVFAAGAAYDRAAAAAGK